jgi:hypothetical protein
MMQMGRCISLALGRKIWLRMLITSWAEVRQIRVMLKIHSFEVQIILVLIFIQLPG